MKTPEFAEGIHFYYNQEGNMVLTEQYLLKKGICCGMGCVHCPYLYENVPEPQKSELIRKNTLNTGNK